MTDFNLILGFYFIFSLEIKLLVILYIFKVILSFHTNIDINFHFN